MLFLALMTGAALGAQTYPTDTFKTTDGKQLDITFLGHGSLLFSWGGKVIYADPVSDYADFHKLPKADVILITHEHSDHLDPKAIEAVSQISTRIIVNGAVRQKLGEGTVLKNGESLEVFPGLKVDAVPAYNTTPGRDIYHPKGRDNGYVLEVGSLRIYVAGDTEDIPEMVQLKNIDIAFLPVNQPYTMTVPQAIHAAQMVRPHILYPYHYGDTDIQVLQEALRDDTGIEVRIRPMR